MYGLAISWRASVVPEMAEERGEARGDIGVDEEAPSCGGISSELTPSEDYTTC